MQTRHISYLMVDYLFVVVKLYPLIKVNAPVKADKKVGRNDPCPCGSGKKYKACCGANPNIVK